MQQQAAFSIAFILIALEFTVLDANSSSFLCDAIPCVYLPLSPQNGEIVGLEERFDLAKGWSLIGREDKKDRFTLVRGELDDDEFEEQVTLRADNKQEASIWINKLTQTAQWLADGGALSLPPQPRVNQPAKGGEPVMCGVGMTLKQHEGSLVTALLDLHEHKHIRI